MKALVLKAYRQFAFEDVPKPVPGPNEVLVRVHACGICGSDVHGMDGSTGRRIPPLIMGHEAAGEVAEMGDSVAGWKVGDRVTFDSTLYCGNCWHCRRGEINLCDQRQVLGVSCAEFRREGAFAEYVAVPKHILYRLPDNLAYEKAALVEAVSVAVHAVARTPLALNCSVAVIGTGMIGLLVTQVLRLAGCGRIIAVDLDPDRLALARRLGATAAVPADAPDLVDQIKQIADGRGVDAVFEVVGTANAVNTALAIARKGASVTLVGNLASRIDIPLQAVVTRQLTLIGSCASAGEYPACLDLLARGRIDVAAIISATPPLAEGARWFERLYAREKGLLKVLLMP